MSADELDASHERLSERVAQLINNKEVHKAPGLLVVSFNDAEGVTFELYLKKWQSKFELRVETPGVELEHTPDPCSRRVDVDAFLLALQNLETAPTTLQEKLDTPEEDDGGGALGAAVDAVATPVSAPSGAPQNQNDEEVVDIGPASGVVTALVAGAPEPAPEASTDIEELITKATERALKRKRDVDIARGRAFVRARADIELELDNDATPEAFDAVAKEAWKEAERAYPVPDVVLKVAEAVRKIEELRTFLATEAMQELDAAGVA